MRIAYITPYQGPELIRRRPTLRNLSLAGNVKIELIADLLSRCGHEVEIFSQGEVVENQTKYFPAFLEPDSFNVQIPVAYASALPIRRVNGLWSSLRTRSLFDSRHKARPFDLVIVYNLKPPQVLCGNHALKRLALPVILEYEDDAFVDVSGRQDNGDSLGWYLGSAQRLLNSVTGCIGVSPYLLSRVPASIPKLLLRGVVGDHFRSIGTRPAEERKKWVAFSGTHYPSKGLRPLIEGWKLAAIDGWELHISGHGSETDSLKRLAEGCPNISFRGFLNREEHARLLGDARIGINPHDLSANPGNVFAFKIVEYLAAGNHVVTTPMGPLEPELEAGITYMPDNRPETIAATLSRVIREGLYEQKVDEVANQRYGPAGVSQALDTLLREVATASPPRSAMTAVGRLMSRS